MFTLASLESFSCSCKPKRSLSIRSRIREWCLWKFHVVFCKWEIKDEAENAWKEMVFHARHVTSVARNIYFSGYMKSCKQERHFRFFLKGWGWRLVSEVSTTRYYYYLRCYYYHLILLLLSMSLRASPLPRNFWKKKVILGVF